jgi:hypothetical protein
MIRAIALAVALLAAAPAPAEEGNVVLTIENHSTMTISALNSFPIDDDGELVEDNLGGLSDDILPGTTGTVDLIGRCGPTFLLVGLGTRTQPDMEFRINTCRSRVLILDDLPE